MNFTKIITIFFLSFLISHSINGQTYCNGPFGGAGAIGDPARWTFIGNPGNSSDPSTGYGAVSYKYSYFDRFVRIADYVVFLNAVDPSNNKNYEGELVNFGVISYSGGIWHTNTWTDCSGASGQSLSAAQVGKIAVSYISFNQAARFANWVATGSVTAGAYTFASSDGNANVTSINLSFNGVRLPTENEFYKAAYYNPSSSTYNTYGTTTLDGLGEPLHSTVSSTGIYNTSNGIAYDLPAHLFEHPAGLHCLWQIQAGQGGQSAYGVYNMSGGFHHFLTKNSNAGVFVLRPQNQVQGGAAEQSKFWRDESLDPTAFYASPSFHLVIAGNECGCSSSINASPGNCSSATNTYTVSGSITFAAQPFSGSLTISVSGGGTKVFNAPFASPINYSITGLVADGLSHSVTAVFSQDASCSATTTFTAPASCTAIPCSIALTSTPSQCLPATNSYTVSGSTSFSGQPTSGTLTISVSGGGSQVFNAPFTSPQAYSIAGQTSDGANHTVTATFSATPACTNSSTYTAPANCTPCSISLTALPGECIPTTNQYTLTGSITFSNAPSTGTLTVQIAGGGSQVFNAPFTSPQAYSISGQTSDGLSHNVSCSFSNNPNCNNNISYLSPNSCACSNTPFLICPGESYTLTAQANLINYQWYQVIGAVETPIAGANSLTYIVTSIGKYKWKATDMNNIPVDACCTNEFISGNCCTLSASCVPTPQTYCNPPNGTVTVNVTGGQGVITYLWSSGETSPTITAKTAGVYSVTVTDNFTAGCTTACSSTISIATTPPNISCSKTDNTNCTIPNGTATATATGVAYLWSNGATTASISGLNAGNYKVTATSAVTGCSSTCNVDVAAPVTMSSLTATPSACDLANNHYTVTGHVTFTNPPTTGTLSVQIAGGGSQVFNAPFTSPQAYSISGQASDGSTRMVTATFSAQNTCTNTISYIAPANCLCTITITPTQPVDCDNAGTFTPTDDKIKFTLNVTSANGGTGYTISATPGTITPTSGIYGNPTIFSMQAGSVGAGDVTVTVTDNATGSCQQITIIIDPIVCGLGGLCLIEAAGLATLLCNDANTPKTSVDDYVSFSLNPTGLGLSTNYLISIMSGGGSVTPSVANYGAATSFQFNAGSASQKYKIIRITDTGNNGCTLDIQIDSPGTCSGCLNPPCAPIKVIKN